MLHVDLNDSKFWDFLLRLDVDLADETRAMGCACGGALHQADYPRKPRGVARSGHPSGLSRRHSFCCARDGCRQRHTPPSVVFLGRRVYLGAVIVLASALGQGLSAHRRAVLQRFGLSERTWLRWRRWWRESVPSSPHWIALRALFAQPIDPQALPGALLDALTPTDARSTLTQTLLLLLPFSTRSTHSSMRVADPQKLRLSPPWTLS